MVEMGEYETGGASVSRGVSRETGFAPREVTTLADTIQTVMLHRKT
jgi:hypothetical protein